MSSLQCNGAVTSPIPRRYPAARVFVPQAVFPCTLRILPTCVFNKKDPIVLGVDIVEGVAKVGTPVAAQTEAGLVELGRIGGMEINHKVGPRGGGRRWVSGRGFGGL